MDKVSPDGEHAAKDVTIVIRRKIKLDVRRNTMTGLDVF
jgi:hypothetical protein